MTATPGPAQPHLHIGAKPDEPHVPAPATVASPLVAPIPLGEGPDALPIEASLERAAQLPPGVRSPAEQQVWSALVRQIAADPMAVRWLREHTARHFQHAAAVLTADGDTRAAATVEMLAGAHRRGDTVLW